ncbi:MAG: DUF4445 domain-containing protein [Sedimentisphaerales bacterium]|nr:DUF4445 domain-containing protein [Sedimentisphaerales bacterium]
MAEHTIRFEPDGREVRVAYGRTLLEAARQAGIDLETVCGGLGTCGKCTVELKDSRERVLACQYPVHRDLVVVIPEAARPIRQRILEEGVAVSHSAADPAVRKIFVQLPEPCLTDLASDWRRLREHLARAALGDKTESADRAPLEIPDQASLSLLRQLPGLLRAGQFSGTAVCHGSSVVAWEPGDTRQSLHGVAVDLGTTTMVLHLVDLRSGQVIQTSSRANPQIEFGDDVISRIQYASVHEGGLQRLQQKVIAALNELIRSVTAAAGLETRFVYEMTVAGNATMQHILLRVPVAHLAQAPYVSVFQDGQDVTAGELDLDIHPQGNVHVLPSIAAHVGGDTVAVALATDLGQGDAPRLALDLGTNGEILLGHRRRLLACSTAAGPAFEGARIAHGMRAATGAIEQVRLNEDVELTVIDEVAPAGICGSGLIDAVAELLRVGILSDTGRLLTGGDLPVSLPENLRRRLVTRDDQPAFLLVDADRTAHGRPIELTQRDIRELQLAKAAVAAGIDLLCRELGIAESEVQGMYLAGAFGNYVRPAGARRIGLIPPLPLDRIRAVGNAAGAGAVAILISRAARRRAADLGRAIEYVELAGRAAFQERFSERMLFPAAAAMDEFTAAD